MSESTEAAEAVEEKETAAPEGVEEAPEPAAAEPADEPEAAADDAPPEDEVALPEPSDEPDPEVAAAEAELAEEAIPVPVGPAAGRQAKVYLCERGHRTVAVWSAPSACHARPTRSGGECGRPLYPIGELPEQVQKALNPLKASKKASKG